MTQQSMPSPGSPDTTLDVLRTAIDIAGETLASLSEPLPPAVQIKDLDITLDAIEAVQAAVNSLEGVRAALVDKLMRQADAATSTLIDATDPLAGKANRKRQRELSRRAAVTDLATTVHISDDAAHRLVDRATAVASTLPRTLRAVLDGTVSWAKAGIIAREVDDLDPAEVSRIEARALPIATTSTPGELRARVRRTRESIHPMPADVRHAMAAEKREVWLDPGRDGMAWLTAHLPAAYAHAVHDRLTSTAGRLRSDGDGRTTGQLRADILTDLLLDDGTLDLSLSGTVPPDASDDSSLPPLDAERRTVGSLAPVARSIRPRVTVTVPVLTLLGAVDAPASLDGLTPIDADTARALCAHAPSFRRILTDPESGAIVSMGRSTYQVPADLKAVLAERDATCRFPGCIRPTARTDLDHTVGWAQGGRTDATNLAHLCRRHHVAKHQTRWRVRQVDDGRHGKLGGSLEWTSPTGRVHRTDPEPTETTRHRAPPGQDLGPPPF